MKRLSSSELVQFARGYRFAGGKLRRLRVSVDAGFPVVHLGLAVHAAMKDLGADPKPARLRLRMDGVEEFRFQKRTNTRAGRVSDVRFGFFNGLFFVNLDAYPLLPGEVPGAHDFRASDAYVAGKDLFWEQA